MRFVKFNGILAEIYELYPNIDLVDFLFQRLKLPIDKAEVLAARIEKELRQHNESKQYIVKNLLERHANPTSEKEAYLVECLSRDEFSHFVRWILEELNFEVFPEKHMADFGVDFLAAKDREKFVFLARQYPKTFKVTDTITLVAQEAKKIYGCDKVVILTTTFFTSQAVTEAKKLDIELWDADILAEKIAEIRKKTDIKEQTQFPQYQGSLFQSLQRLVETKLFIIESRVGEKYDLFVPWIKYPLLTYQTNSNNVTRCVYRIKYNNPVTEFEGENLIYSDRAGNRIGPNDEQAYTAILQYLKQFME